MTCHMAQLATCEAWTVQMAGWAITGPMAQLLALEARGGQWTFGCTMTHSVAIATQHIPALPSLGWLIYGAAGSDTELGHRARRG